MTIKCTELSFLTISFFKLSLSNWKELKPQIKRLVDLDLEKDRIDICYSDYFKYNNRPPYMIPFIHLIEDELLDFFNGAGMAVQTPDNWQMWSQTYKGTDSHPLHNHGFGNLSAILYLDFDKELQLSSDLFKFYEYCRKKLIEGITSLKSKEIMKSAVNLDKMFDFKYFQVDEEINAV